MVNIYSLSDPITGEIRYVGKTVKNIQRRLSLHLQDAKSLNHHTANWIKSLRKQGLKPISELLDIVDDDNWGFWEKYWISQCKAWGFRLTNHTEGGDGGCGVVVSEESKRKKSETLKRRIAAGEIVYSEERCRKISEAHKGKILSDITKEKLRQCNLGKKYSEKSKAKKYKAITQYDLEDNFIREWKSLTDAANTLGILKGGISSAILRENNNSYKGFIWKFKN